MAEAQASDLLGCPKSCPRPAGRPLNEIPLQGGTEPPKPIERPCDPLEKPSRTFGVRLWTASPLELSCYLDHRYHCSNACYACYLRSRLDSYIYDYLLKRNLQNTAKAFQAESNVPSAPVCECCDQIIKLSSCAAVLVSNLLSFGIKGQTLIP